MVKTIIVIFAAAMLIGFIEAKMTKEEMTENFKEHVKSCLEETGISAEKDKIFKSDVLESKEGKCFWACVYKRKGLMKDGKYDLEGATTATKMFFDEGTPDYDSMMEMVKKCEAEVNKEPESDECEMAAKIAACQKPYLTSAGIAKQ